MGVLMTKRYLAAAAGAALALLGTANARPIDGWQIRLDDRSDLATSRSCLTSDTRALLDRIETEFGPVRLVSTCRPGAVIAGTGRRSKHGSGQAIDFDAPQGRKAELVKWLIENHHSGGVMTYRDMDHIHVDIGQHFVALNRWSGRGG